MHPQIWRVISSPELIFREYEYITGLALNVSKTVLVPLSAFDPADLRSRLAALVPLWGALDISPTAKYLGFYVGPGRADKSWNAAATKFLDRAEIWGKLGLGLYHTIDA